MDRIKAHFERNKTRYLMGSYVVVAGATVLVTRGVVLRGAGPNFEGVKIIVRPISIFSKQIIYTIINVDRSGPLSWVVRCVETGEVFISQHAAAVAKGLSEPRLSSHLNGVSEHVGGLHFERIGLAG